MDILSDVVTVMRTGRPVSARVEWHAPWTRRFAEVPGAAGFQVVLQGTCRIVGPEPIQLGVGDVVFLPHATDHVLANGDSATTVTLCGAYEVDPGRVHPLLRSLPGRIHLPARLGRHPELRATVDLLSAELENPRVGGDAVVPALLEALLLYILRAYFDDQPPEGWSGALKDGRITTALRAIHDEPGRQWTVASLAARAGMSRAPFARRFKELTGQPPLTYLTWWRMTTAGRLLKDTDLSLHTIATRVGYASEFAFAHAFKRETGQPPGKFRSTVE